MANELKTIVELPAGNAPLLTDLMIVGQDPGGTLALVKQELTSIRNLFVGAPTAAGDFPASIDDSGKYVKRTLAQTKTILGVDVHYYGATISNPQAMYSQRAQIPLFFTKRGAITISRIRVDGNDITPTSELAGDLKHADDKHDGGFANAAVIDVVDTTNGVFEATSGFDDATVPVNKWIYLQLDASPHADWKDITVEFDYTYD